MKKIESPRELIALEAFHRMIINKEKEKEMKTKEIMELLREIKRLELDLSQCDGRMNKHGEKIRHKKDVLEHLRVEIMETLLEKGECNEVMEMVEKMKEVVDVAKKLLKMEMENEED